MKTRSPRDHTGGACGAVYRLRAEGGPARSCVLPPGHEGGHEDVRALLDRVAKLEADQAAAYQRGAEAMRERAAAHISAEGGRQEAQAREWHSPLVVVACDARAIVCHRLADEIRALPLDDDAREDAQGGS